MHLRSLKATGYRSLRSIVMETDDVNVFVGANGVGKSNLYKALALVRAAAVDRFAHEIAVEGGMLSALWSGPRRKGVPVRIALEVELLDGAGGVAWTYAIEAGLKPPAAAGFPFEPQIKTETLSAATGGRRAVAMMKRDGPAVAYRDGDGRMADYPVRLLPSETGLAALGGSGLSPETAVVRDALAGWRFYHGFRTDAGSPLRAPCLAVTAPMLDMDGANLAAVLATLAHIRGDTVDLDRAVEDAFPGARLDIAMPEELASFGLSLPEFPQRVFSPRELSDGQIRFLGLAAALLAYRRPPFIALNEPEASLHPSMLPALAGMIERAAHDAQIWIVTHSTDLADLVAERCNARRRTVIRREDGATWIEGMTATGTMNDDEDDV
jgi:predicted ATPase